MKKEHLLIGGIAFAAGVIITGVVFFSIMPSMMLITHEAAQGYDETVAVLKERIEQSGWTLSSVIEMNQSLAKHNVNLQPRVTLLKICHPDYAKSVLETNRDVSVMMPCTFSVWEGDDGKVYVSGMNIGLMGKLFGGNVARIMGGKVVKDEEKMLEGLLR